MTDALNDITFADHPNASSEEKNTTDYYKKWETEAIRADLDSKRVPMVNICMNLTGEFNKSSVIRANNAFLGQEVWLVGKRRFDRRGTVGTHHYEHIKHAEDYAPLFEKLIADGYTIFPVDNIESYDPKAIYDVELPEKSAFVYGEEMLGLSEELIQACNGKMVYIPQYGSVRSINVAQAAAVTMYEYSRQHRK